MKSLDHLSYKEIEKIKLVCFDVDGVTIKKGTQISAVESKGKKKLVIKTQLLPDEVREKLLLLKEYFYIAINSGRSTIYLKDVFNDLLWDNVALIGEVGIFTLSSGELIQHEKFDKKTLEKMRTIKKELEEYADKTTIREAFEPKQFLITFHTRYDDKNVHEILRKVDPEGEFEIFWSGEAFDILPKGLNKGTALKTLCRHLKIDPKETIAIGNGNNDRDMTETAGIGISTEPKVLEADYFTTESQHLGGVELAEKLIQLKRQNEG